MQLNSLFNPLFYCYRDHRFKNAIREMLEMKKPQPMSSSLRDTQNVRGNNTFRSSELHIVEKRIMPSVTRSASCNLTHASTHVTPSVVMLKKSLSAPTPGTCSSSSVSLDLQ